MVLLVSIDGLRPDAISPSTMPNLHGRLGLSAHTLQASSVMPSVTLPCHTSMHRGVDVPRHGITTNTFMPLARPVPALMDVISSQGLRCGAFFNWGPLRDLYEPESVDVSVFVKSSGQDHGDAAVVEAVLRHWEGLDFAFVYLGHTDEAGHKYGWMSPGYLAAATEADRQLGRLIEESQQEDAFLVLSDHGGHDRSHGTNMPEDMTIPFVLWGPGIAPVVLPGPVRLYDVPTTLASILGVPASPRWEGTDVLRTNS